MPALKTKLPKLPINPISIHNAPPSAFASCLHLPRTSAKSTASSPYSTRILFHPQHSSDAPLKQQQGLLFNRSCTLQRNSFTSPFLHRALPVNLRNPSRNFTSTLRRQRYKTVEQARSRARVGPFSIASVVVFLSLGTGMVFYFRYEKARMERKRIADASKGVGKPKVGGKFELVDQEGKDFSSEERMKGRFSLVYFGFTHCPDICPEELDKMSSMIDLVSATFPSSPSSPLSLLPLFITCDPARDTPSVLKSYLQEFHPAMVGLTGTWEQIKAVCKLYRVYFSTPEGVKPGMDYLVDHSIYFYLMDPDNDFVEAIGRQHSAEQAAKIITAHMSDWKRSGKTTL